MYLDYFSNILSRTWAGRQTNKTQSSIEKSEISDIYFEFNDMDKLIIIGKTEKFFFLLECLDSDGYKYSNGLFNDDLIELIHGYKNRNVFISDNNIESFVKSILFKNKLSKQLAEKNLSQIKKFKI